MRNLKKILALVLALMMVLSVMVTASAASFNDADEINSDYSVAVEVMSGIGVIEGMGNGNFNPKGTLTRAQAAKIISYICVGSLEEIEALADATANPFSDVSAWAVPYVLYAYNEGIIVGDGNGKYSPNRELTGYEFGKMLLIATGICDSADFTADGWKLTVAKELKAAGLLDNVSVTLSKNLTREQACQMAFDALYYTTTASYVWTVDGVEFSSESAALVYCLSTSVTDYPELVEVPTGSLADKVFGLSSGIPGTDASGRPYTYWIAKEIHPSLPVATVYETPAITLTAPTTTGKLYTALGLRSGTTGTAGYNVYNNGTYTVGADVVIALNGVTTVGNYGLVTEIYTDDDGYPTRMVNIEYTYSCISDVTTGYELNGSAYTAYTIDGNSYKVYTKALNKELDEIDPNGAGKYDDILYYIDNAGFVHVEPVSYITGMLTYATSTGVYTISGTDYRVATGVVGATAPAGWYFNHTYAVDSNGYILGDVTPGAATKYLYVVAADSYTTLVNGKLTTAILADVMYTDGTVETITVATVDGATATVGATGNTLPGLYTYTQNAAGNYVLVSKAYDVASISATNPAIASGVYANDSTVYVYANWAWNSTLSTYVFAGTTTVVTGYKNAATASAVVGEYIDLYSDGIADVVFVYGYTPVSTVDQYVYYTGVSATDGINNIYTVIADTEYTTVKNVTFGSGAGLYHLVGSTATPVTTWTGNSVKYNGGLLYVGGTYNNTVAATVPVYVIQYNAVTALTAADLTTAVSGNVLVVNNLAGAVAAIYIVK